MTSRRDFEEEIRTLFRIQQLVDDDVMGVDLIGRQLLDQTLRLVKRQEFRDGDADESRLVLVVEGNVAHQQI